MKKIFYLLILFILLINTDACTGYKPIFSSPDLSFKIVDYSISGDKKLGKLIYSKLNNLFKSTSKTLKVKDIYIYINTKKSKEATAKDNTGKILGYKINLFTIVTVKDFITEEEIVHKNFSYSSSYQVQSAFSETTKLEIKSIENLINKTYQDILIKLSESIL